MANIKDFIKKIGNNAVSLEEQQKALAQVEQTIIEAKQKRTEAIGKNAEMVVQALKTIEAKLEAKLEELNNTPAKQGIQGPAGKPGKDGKDGLNGRDGVNGKDGKDGKDGVNGNDGVSVVDAKIDFDGSLVIYLSNGSEIDAGQILSPDVAQNIIINSGGSGTSQTVTDTLVSLQNQINTLTGIDGVLGDMAQQNANAVAITGGTINGTSIGATTQSTGAFTTITGQTEVLRGTGQNLVTQSQTFSTWTLGSGAGITANATTDPNGGNTGTYFYATNPSATYPSIQQSFTCVPNTSYVISLYVKAAERTTVTAQMYGNNSVYINEVANSSLTSSWVRIQLTFNTSTYTSIGFRILFSGSTVTWTGTQGIYIWGAMAEFGTTANTYIPTTTTAVYGTPTLSFSGVSTLGLEQTGALYLQPAGTGAIQAQATTSTSAGGNARGANAVDWQTTRNSATQVASGTSAVLTGGLNNNSNAFGGFVGSGNSNLTSGSYNVVVDGVANLCQTTGLSFIGNGNANQANGWMNFIGTGYQNAGTAGSAVTTQATTTVTNGSTAVTLSGSNANIKVGQLITGTGIATYPHTYVAAISGTSLTLSQNANASGSPTLSFFTPHGVVVGGGNNQATGSYSFIGGGGDAGTSANRNVASGDWSFVGGGALSVASGLGSVVCGGGYGALSSLNGNTASGAGSFIGGGAGNTASAQGSMILGGATNTANGAYSTVLGYQGSSRSIQQSFIFSTPRISVNGDSQSGIYIERVQTADATPTVLTTNGNAAGTTNQVILPNNSAYYFTGEVVSGVTGGGNSKGWEISGLIKRGANAAATTLVGSTVTSLYADAGAVTWTIALAADTTNGGLRVTFTGQAGTTIRTVCQIRTTEMTF